MTKQSNLQQAPTLRFRRMTHKGYGAFNTMHRVVTIGTLSSLALACAYSSTASAQNVSGRDPRTSPDREREYEIEAVTVTASKLATPLGEATKLVTVLSAKEIAAAPVRSIQDLLVYVAGVDVSQRGAHGVQSDISIRGGHQDQTLVLLNGVNLTSAQTGHLSFDLPVNLSDIERIEVLRGPAALIYGSGAFSGAINIITRHDQRDGFSATISAGQHRLFGVEARGTTKWGRSINSLSASSRSSAGYIDNTDYLINRALWQTQYQLSPADKMTLQVGMLDKQFGANSFYSVRYPMQYEYSRRYFSSLRGELGSGRLRIIPTLAWDRGYDQFDLTKGSPQYRNYHRSNNYSAILALNYSSALGLTTLAGELRHEEIVSSNLGRLRVRTEEHYTKYDGRTNSSLALEHSLRLEQWTLSAGALLQATSLEGVKTRLLPSASISYRPTGALSLSASWSRSMRLPSFTDLWYSSPIQQAGTGLREEQSEGVELSARYTTSLLQGYVSGFFSHGTNLLDWTKTAASDTKWVSRNIGKTDSRGLELGLSLRYGEYLPFLGLGSRLQLDYLYMTQEHDAGQIISMYALNYLKHKFTARLGYQIGPRLEGSCALRVQKRVSQSEAYATLDAKLDYLYSSRVKLGLEVSNLTATKYNDFAGVEQPRRWVAAQLSYSL